MRWPLWPKKSKERRRSPRARVDCLEAVYWDGSGSSRHAIREISFHGALIETDTSWMYGTLIRLCLRRSSLFGESIDPEVYSELWCRVVRGLPDGLCVEFLFIDKKERRNFLRFLAANDVRLEDESRNIKKAIMGGAGTD